MQSIDFYTGYLTAIGSCNKITIIMAIPETCSGKCGPSSFVRDRGGYKVFCPAGIQGGCSGPSSDQLDIIGHQAAMETGTTRQTPPLRFDEIGLPVARRWY